MLSKQPTMSALDKSIYCPPTINMRSERNGSSPLPKAMKVGQKDVLIDYIKE